MILVIGLWPFLRALCLGPAAIALENLALRHQLLVLQRSVTRPRLSRWDRIFWVWLSCLDAEICHLIRRMAQENPTWGRRRIQAELALLGYEVAELTVAKYMDRTSPRPFANLARVSDHLCPRHRGRRLPPLLTQTSRLLFVFVVLRHDRRELLHIDVTDHPAAVWAAQQLIEAFPDDSAPKFLLRD